MGNVKAEFHLCRNCKMLAKIQNPGGATTVHCMAGAFSNLISKGKQIGVLKLRGKDYHGVEREARFSNRGPWHIPHECPWYLQHSFLQAERNMGIIPELAKEEEVPLPEQSEFDKIRI